MPSSIPLLLAPLPTACPLKDQRCSCITNTLGRVSCRVLKGVRDARLPGRFESTNLTEIEGPSAPYVWIGTAYSTLLLVVTTFLLTYKFTTVLLLLIQLLQTTTYTIITEYCDGPFQSISLRDLRAMGVDSFIESQDLTKPPWDRCPRKKNQHFWINQFKNRSNLFENCLILHNRYSSTSMLVPYVLLMFRIFWPSVS